MAERRAGGDATGAEELVQQLNAALNARTLYPADHPRVGEAVERLLTTLARELDARGQDEVTLLLVGEELVADHQALRRRGVQLQAFGETLRRRGLEGLTLLRGLDREECHRFLDGMAAGLPAASDHIIAGRLRATVAADGSEGLLPGADGGGEARGARILSAAGLEEGRAAFVRLRSDRLAGVAALEKLVWELMDSLVTSADEFYPLAPLRDHDELTYLHSVNVSLLVLAMGRAYGYQGQLLHDMGVAALLHDLGKLSVPAELLTRPGPLDEEEWKLMKLHPELGALHICELEVTSRLPTLVAYEHHLRYDGKPNYPPLSTPRAPILASRMTSVADNYDAMTGRVQPRALSHAEALEMLRHRAGSYLDPVLVEGFCTMFAERPESAA
jgi:HD-GYP domain-containing protein (c-di-GMP phosphodiesterase class II)